MVNVIRLFSDMTFEEISRKAKENKIKINNLQEPTFKEGKAIFRERNQPIWKFWKRRRNLAVYTDGSFNLFELNDGNFVSQFGTREDWERYLAGRMEKLRNKNKSMQNWQFIILAIMLGIVVVLELRMSGVIHF